MGHNSKCNKSMEWNNSRNMLSICPRKRDITCENPVYLLLCKMANVSSTKRVVWACFSADLLVVDDAYHIARFLQLKINKRRVRIKARRGAHFSWKLINVGLRLFGSLQYVCSFLIIINTHTYPSRVLLVNGFRLVCLWKVVYRLLYLINLRKLNGEALHPTLRLKLGCAWKRSKTDEG